MGRSFAAGIIACIEYGIVCLFAAALSFILAQSAESFVQSTYDYSAEQELLKAVRQGYETRQITSQQSAEILQIYRQKQAKLQRTRSYIFYAVSICISAGLAVSLFRKYRSLRFRERFREHFLQAPKP
ncbi:MAG: hypothetical protein JW947_07305 [Sedimentisphaerales bacterium]|nr:hypothetical protein [Sedimentisphaerales bacterium]